MRLRICYFNPAVGAKQIAPTIREKEQGTAAKNTEQEIDALRNLSCAERCAKALKNSPRHARQSSAAPFNNARAIMQASIARHGAQTAN